MKKNWLLHCTCTTVLPPLVTNSLLLICFLCKGNHSKCLLGLDSQWVNALLCTSIHAADGTRDKGWGWGARPPLRFIMSPMHPPHCTYKGRQTLPGKTDEQCSVCVLQRMSCSSCTRMLELPSFELMLLLLFTLQRILHQVRITPITF